MKLYKKIIMSLGVAVLVLLPVFTAMPQFAGKASADIPVDSATYADEARSYVLFLAIAGCFLHAPLAGPGDGVDTNGYPPNATISPALAVSGALFGPLAGVIGGGSRAQAGTGFTDTSGNADGWQYCDEVGLVPEALQLWGVNDPQQMLCSMGFTRTNGSDCKNGDGPLVEPGTPKNSLVGLAVGQAKTMPAFRKFINNQFYGNGTTATPILDAPGKYAFYTQSFMNLCGPPTAAPGFDQLSDSDIAHSTNLFRLTGSDGTTQTTFTSSKKRSDTVVVNDNNDGSLHKMSCADLVTGANANAKAYANGDPDLQGGIDDGTGDVSDSAGDPDLSCGLNGSGFGSFVGAVLSLRWLLCPLVNGFGSAAGTLDNAIMDMLCVNEAQVFSANAVSTCSNSAGVNSSTSVGYKTAWNVFRLLALGLLVIAALVMILSQTMGLEIFDAYTIRKVLPRLLIAAIAITLSWQLMQFFVGLSNILGVGIRGLIYAPFHSAGLNQVVLGGGTSAVAFLTGLGAFAFLGPLGLLSFVATGMLAILIAFFVLVLRNLLIVALVISAPIGIVAYILPNTEKYWKIWWEWFSRALMVFPIITAFIAIGHIFAAIATAQGNQQGGTTGTISNMAGFIAYFAPYFLIPAAFRFAGGALSTIGGFVNDRNRGAFDRLRKFRQGRAAYNMQRLQNQTRWNPNSKIGDFGNKVGTWVTDPGSNTALRLKNVPGFRMAGHNVASQLDGAKADQTGKLFDEVNKLFGSNDKVYRMLAGEFGGTDMRTKQRLTAAGFGSDAEGWAAPKSLDDLQKVSGILNQSESATERTAGLALSGSMGRLANLYRDADMSKANMQGAGIMGLAAHGFSDGDDIADVYNTMRAAGNSEGFANAIAQQSQVYVSRSRPDAKAGYGTTVETDNNGNRVMVSGLRQMGEDGHVVEYETRDADGNVTYNDDALGLRGFDALKAIGPGDISGAKGGFLKKLGKQGQGSGVRSHLEFVLDHGDTNEARNDSREVARIRAEAKAAPNDAAKQRAAWELTHTTEGRMKVRRGAAADLYVPMRDELLQNASYYSHASSDIKSGAIDILSRDDKHRALLSRYEASRADAEHGAHEEQPPHPEGEEGN